MHELKIGQTQSILNLQKLFNGIYPFLKIEFFTKSHGAGEGISKKFMITENKLLKEIQNGVFKAGSIKFNDDTTVIALEEDFKKKFGLNVILFRKSGKIWLEITNTDNWTLKQQNEEGKSLESSVYLENENADDHDIY
jgi:hypothetical protein